MPDTPPHSNIHKTATTKTLSVKGITRHYTDTIKYFSSWKLSTKGLLKKKNQTNAMQNYSEMKRKVNYNISPNENYPSKQTKL